MGESLANIRVLDASQGIAGPFCTKLLAGCGAEVIKVEPAGRGDACRSFGPFLGNTSHYQESALFMHLNTRKKSVSLNLMTEAGRGIFRELTRVVDVVVEGFRPGVMRELCLDYEALKKENPNLVMTSFSNYGQSGPWSGYEATEIDLQATSGVMSVTGDADKEPLKAYGHQCQYMAGLQGAVAAFAAVYLLQGTGQGQYVDVSIQESATMFVAGGDIWSFYFGEVPTRAGARVAQTQTRRTYSGNILPCRDGYVWFGTGHNQDMLALLVDEPKLASPELWRQPWPHADEIDEACRRWLTQHTKMEAVRLGQELRVAIAPVLDLEEIASDPQHHAREFLRPVDLPVVGKVTMLGAPFKMSHTPWSVARPPLLGEHTEEVLAELLGYGRRHILLLREAGAI